MEWDSKGEARGDAGVRTDAWCPKCSCRLSIYVTATGQIIVSKHDDENRIENKDERHVDDEGPKVAKKKCRT